MTIDIGSKPTSRGAKVNRAILGTRVALKRGVPDINPIVGAILHRLRMASGQSQSAVAKAIGLTFQQVQKYERGTNKISLATLIVLADYFDVPLATFTDPARAAACGTQTLIGIPERRPAASRIRLELGREINQIQDDAVLRPILDLLRTINGADRHGPVPG